MNRDSYEKDRANLPADTTEIIIDGGCHAQFGCYGAQDGDGTPTISAAEQISQTSEAIAAFVAAGSLCLSWQEPNPCRLSARPFGYFCENICNVMVQYSPFYGTV